MSTPTAKIEDILDDIEEKVHNKDDFVGTNNIDKGNANQKLQRAEEEQEQASMEDSNHISKKN